jgi:hypothetical protein
VWAAVGTRLQAVAELRQPDAPADMPLLHAHVLLLHDHRP